ncbi:DUF4349 domain-containing protein [Marmoricola sp. URHB0036]|uniref:DUF4349 domain-containing protein n=1 Tax=Marmoricola sp. URHB0036 TaxID=1298863 RepID=UPI00041FA6B9|nr:DUF4349 domain-containing protein [Marmoricola sp. URHB0036]
MTKKQALVITVLLVVLGVVYAAMVLGGRDGDNVANSDSSGATADTAGGSTEPSASALKAEPDSSIREASVTTPMTRAVISTGQVTLHAKDMARARSEVVRLVTSWGGSVADEQSTSDEHGRLADSTLTLRVPSDHFDEAMSAFGTLGEVEQRSQKSEDVTTKVIDTDARVRAGERSVQQIEALLSRAQKLGDVIAIENDLARRQADLDSLKSQQAWLEDQTSLSTITVYLSRPMVHGTTHEAKGFLAGLENGWDAFRATFVAVLTGLGAVLPFAVLLALLGVPLWWVVRRRRLPSTPVAEA